LLGLADSVGWNIWIGWCADLETSAPVGSVRRAGEPGGRRPVSRLRGLRRLGGGADV